MKKWFVASGALGWDGSGWPWEKPLVWSRIIDPSLFTITTKTLTLNPNKGDWRAVKIYRRGVWNNMGLPNKGLHWWLNKHCPLYVWLQAVKGELGYKLKYKTLLSLTPFNKEEAKEMLFLLYEHGIFYDSNFKGIELNVSCPNTNAFQYDQILDIISAFKCGDMEDKLIIIKLNYMQALHSTGFTNNQLKELLPLCGAVSLNSVPDAFREGAWSGRFASDANWATASNLKSLGFKVIFPSIWKYEDIQKCFDMGADAISFGSVHLLRPWAPTRWVRRYEKENKNESKN